MVDAKVCKKWSSHFDRLVVTGEKDLMAHRYRYSLNASKPSEHPPDQGGKLSKRLLGAGNIGSKHKNSHEI